MAANPEQLLEEIRRYVLDPIPANRGPWAEPGGFQGSENLKFIRILGDLVGGAPPDEMEAYLRAQIERGVMVDELGSGYAGSHVHAALVLWRWCSNWRLALLDLTEEWLGLVMRFYLLHAVTHRDSVIAATPGTRKRRPTVNAMDRFLQSILVRPLRKYGLEVKDLQDHAGYYWRAIDYEEMKWIGDTIVIPADQLARKCGVPTRDTEAVLGGRLVAGGTRYFTAIAPFRTHWPTVLARYTDGSVVSYIEECVAHDAPMPGIVARADGSMPQVLQMQPTGPRATPLRDANGKVVREADHQWWGGSNLQRAWVEGGELRGELVGLRGIRSPGDDGWSVEAQRPRVPLPPGSPVIIVRFTADYEPEFLVRYPGTSAAPTPTPPTGGPMPTPTPRSERQQLGIDAAKVAGEAHRGERTGGWPDGWLSWASVHFGVTENELREWFEGRR